MSSINMLRSITMYFFLQKMKQKHPKNGFLFLILHTYANYPVVVVGGEDKTARLLSVQFLLFKNVEIYFVIVKSDHPCRSFEQKD